jgi:two-component system response regulator AtoC
MAKILIVDDETNVRESLRFALKDQHTIRFADSGEKALKEIAYNPPDLVILDIMMPGKSGIDTLREIKRDYAHISVIMLTAAADLSTAINAMKLGASDYITKPYDVEELLFQIEKIIDQRKLHQKIGLLQEEVEREYPVASFIFKSEKMKEVLDIAKKAAPTESSIILTGPTGVGKELVARFIHTNSTREKEPFVAIHCAAIPDTLFESELFGYERGAFTNAFKRKPGKIEMAAEGTIFLDEVNEIPSHLQVKLLRFLQEKKFSRLGSNELLSSNARILSASSQSITPPHKTFREDLYYRLSVVPIAIPSLTERKEDIVPIAEYYIEQFAKKYKSRAKTLSFEAEKAFLAYPWPGNVRELKNVIERSLVLRRDAEKIDIEILPSEISENSLLPYKELSLEEEVRQLETTRILHALTQEKGNQVKTAKRLGITRRILRYKMEKLQIACEQQDPNE